LLIAGTSDSVVDPGNTIRLAARLREKGAQVQSRLYPRVGHGGLAGAFGKPIRGLAPVLRETVTFVSTVTAKVQEAA
jgi:acetyl esterase/lipase